MLDEAALQEVRDVTFSLLDLEMKSYKWYKDSALGYFIDMEQQIAKTCGIGTNSDDYETCFMDFISARQGCGSP